MNKSQDIPVTLAMYATKPQHSILVLLKDYFEKNIVDEENFYTEYIYLRHSIIIICANVILDPGRVKNALNDINNEVYNFLKKSIDIDYIEYNNISAKRFDQYKNIHLALINKNNNEFVALDCGDVISENLMGFTNPLLSANCLNIFIEETKTVKNLINSIA